MCIRAAWAYRQYAQAYRHGRMHSMDRQTVDAQAPNKQAPKKEAPPPTPLYAPKRGGSPPYPINSYDLFQSIRCILLIT